MKTKLLFLSVLFAFCTAAMASHPADSNSRKGHFVFGANLFTYTFGSHSIHSGGYSQSYSMISASFNLWGGYFVSNRVCVGLNFGNPSNDQLQAFGVVNNNTTILNIMVPSNIFFRYHLSDSDKNVSFFLEGIAGGNYSSISVGGSSSETVVYVDVIANIAASLRISKHFDAQLRVGGIYNYYNFAIRSAISSPALTSSLGIQYKL